MPSKPKTEPVSDDEAPERLVADQGRQESGDRPWQGAALACGGILTGPAHLSLSGCVVEDR